MSDLLVAAREFLGWIQERGASGCLIGGLAVQRWGEPRLTQDVDVTVVVQDEPAFIDTCLQRFAPRLEDARAFAERHRVVLVRASNGVGVDVSLGAIPFEVEAADRATAYEFAPGFSMPTCSAEDLVVYKAIAGRPRDVADLDGILARQRGRLDLERIRRWLRAFAEVEMSEASDRFEQALGRANRNRPV